jgi:serine/threonine-protein kinase
MYQMLTGRPPFRGKSYEDTLSQIIARDPVEPRRVNPRVPKDLETVVLKCLRKDAADRYGTAEALGQDLRRFVRGDPIEARPR